MNRELLLQMTGISKHFGGVTALQEVDFEVYENEIVGLVGDNGAGKSTLVKTLAGVYPPDSGQIVFQGKQVEFSHPSEANALGIQVIYQDLALVDTFNLPSNFFLGNEIMKKVCWGMCKFIDQKQMARVSRGFIKERLGISIDNWYDPVRVLSGGQRQAIPVAKAVYSTAKLIVMDEPTAALGVAEAEKLFEIIEKLKRDGISVVMIAHNLEHIFRVVDRIVILRQSKRAGERLVSDTTTTEIVHLMLGAV